MESRCFTFGIIQEVFCSLWNYSFPSFIYRKKSLIGNFFIQKAPASITETCVLYEIVWQLRLRMGPASKNVPTHVQSSGVKVTKAA